MAIRITEGTSINFQENAIAPDTGNTLTVESQPPTLHALQIGLSRQRRSLWCWAACARMVLSGFGEDVEQCEIVSFLLDPLDCCVPGTHGCNHSCEEPDILNIYERFNINGRLVRKDVKFNTIRNAIDNEGQPVEICVEWDEGGAHVILIYGWSKDGPIRFVKVHDPLYGSGEIRFSDLLRYRSQGNWTRTWLDFSGV